MAIKRVVHKLGGAKEHMVVPEFTFATNVGTYSNTARTGDLLAQMIVDAWQNVQFAYAPPGAKNAVVTISIAPPALITWVAHGLVAGSEVGFTTTGALPTGLALNTGYYVTANAALTANTFNVSDTPAHALAGIGTVTTTGIQSGVQTGWTVVTVNLGDALLARDPHTHLPTGAAVQVATAYVQNTVLLPLTRAVVISEAEHDNDYILQSDDEIAFVLPNPTRVVSQPIWPTSNVLLATAEFLMACTPNGI